MQPFSTWPEKLKKKIEAVEKYLTFTLNQVNYGIQAMKTKAVIRMRPILPLPNLAACARGVICHQREVIPVIDLRKRLSVNPADCSDKTRIIIVEIKYFGLGLDVGAIVDAVDEMLDIPTNKIDEHAPDSLSGGRSIRGVARINNRENILLEPDQLFTMEEILRLRTLN